MELVNCICDCVHNVLQGNIPVNDIEKDRLIRYKECLRVGKEENFGQETKAFNTGGWIPWSAHPYTRRISRKTVHWTIMDEIVTNL